MLNPNDINIPDIHMRYIMTLNAQNMAVIQLMIEKGIITEDEITRYTEAAKRRINEEITKNMEESITKLEEPVIWAKKLGGDTIEKERNDEPKNGRNG